MPLLTTGRITPASLTTVEQDFKKIQAFIDYTADPNHINQPRSDRARSLEVTNIKEIITKVGVQLTRIRESAPDKNLLEVGKKILADLNHNMELYKKGASVSVDGTSERNAQTQESANTQSKIAAPPARPQWTRRQSLTADQVVTQVEKAENHEKIGSSVATGPK